MDGSISEGFMFYVIVLVFLKVIFLLFFYYGLLMFLNIL